mmetsp:Transcript_82619/g.212838  ORF Transcript_82619/g.212838 Transcript_82619/m.212838 type:complete len:267 (+) Transcript_82619:1858-2658(+)
MEDGHTWHAARPLQARDLVAHLILARVAAARHDHGHCAGLRQHLHVSLRELGSDAALEHLVKVAVQQRHDGLRLRVAKAAIELDDLGAVSREHEPRKEAAHKGDAIGGHAVNSWLEDMILDGLEQGGVHRGRRSKCPHATCVRALIAIVHTLVVLRRWQHCNVLAIGERQHRALHTLHHLLQDNLLAGVAHGSPLEEVTHRLLGLLTVGRHDHPLASSKAAGLDHDLEWRLIHELEGCLQAAGASEVLVGRRGDLVTGHEVLGESL